MGRILIGTASWADPGLIRSGRFYPSEVRTSEARLRFYAEQFPVVEVDSSFYALPSYRNAELWAERTPVNFVFNVKMFRFFTGHPTGLSVLPPEIRAALGDSVGKNLYYKDAPSEVRDELWRLFRLSLEPLVRAGKLGALLFQFPRWFIVRRSSFDHLRDIRERLAEYQVAIEFRHESWFRERHRETTLRFEREMQFCNVVVDEPQGVPGSIPTVWEVTDPRLAMFRLHGRNAQMWNMRGLTSAAERFNYEYTAEELSEFAPRIREVAARAQAAHVIANVNWQDQGIRTARTMLQLLSEPQGGQT